MDTKIATAAAAADDDYPCVRRLWHRRLLAYLYNHGFQAAFHSMIQELGQDSHTIFSAAHLRKLLAGGQWHEAAFYVHHLLPLPPVEVEARTLILTLANIVATDTGAVAVIPAWQRRFAVLISAKLSSGFNIAFNSPLYW